MPVAEGTRQVAEPAGVSIGWRLALATVGVLVVVSALLYRELTRREREGLVAAKVTAANMVADLFAASLAAPLDFADNDAVQAELANLHANPEVSCAAVFSADGDAPVAQITERCDASAAPAEQDLATPRVSADRVEVSRAVVARGKPVGRARVVFSLARENAAFDASRARIFWLSAVLAAGTAAVLLALARRLIVGPLARLVEAAGRVGKGDLGARVEVASSDEIGQLGRAFNRMSVALAERDRALADVTRRIRELLDHMRQAILAFDRGGRVTGEASAQARVVFGENLEGTLVRELLYAGLPDHDVDIQALGEWLDGAFEVPLENWEEFAKLAPKELAVRRPDGSEMTLELEFRPIEKNQRVDRVMLLATDVSEVRRLEQTVEAQVEEHARRMAAMRRLVAGGAHLFVAFTEKARDQLSECLATLGAVSGDVPRAALDAVFRRAHTMRSEARAFDLSALEGELTTIEELLSELRSASDAGVPMEAARDIVEEILAALRRASDAVLEAREDFVTVSPVGRAALDQMTVQRSDVDEVLALTAGQDGAIARAVSRLAARRFGESTATLLEMAPAWAAREEKQVHLDVDGRDVRISPALARVLGGVLMQLVRNAIAHGVETPLERTREGKEPLGTVRVRAKEGAGGATVIVEDDGRGLDEERILARARALGIEGPAGEAVFQPGLTTRAHVDEVAGRGVGLDAVREELTTAGYRIRVESTKGKGTRYLLEPVAPAA